MTNDTRITPLGAAWPELAARLQDPDSTASTPLTVTAAGHTLTHEGPVLVVDGVPIWASLDTAQRALDDLHAAYAPLARRGKLLMQRRRRAEKAITDGLDLGDATDGHDQLQRRLITQALAQDAAYVALRDAAQAADEAYHDHVAPLADLMRRLKDEALALYGNAPGCDRAAHTLQLYSDTTKTPIQARDVLRVAYPALHNVKGTGLRHVKQGALRTRSVQLALTRGLPRAARALLEEAYPVTEGSELLRATALRLRVTQAAVGRDALGRAAQSSLGLSPYAAQNAVAALAQSDIMRLFQLRGAAPETWIDRGGMDFITLRDTLRMARHLLERDIPLHGHGDHDLRTLEITSLHDEVIEMNRREHSRMSNARRTVWHETGLQPGDEMPSNVIPVHRAWRRDVIVTVGTARFLVTAATSQHELAAESDALHHCVGHAGYGHSAREGNIVLVLMRTEQPGAVPGAACPAGWVPGVTAELSPSLRVRQARGRFNRGLTATEERALALALAAQQGAEAPTGEVCEITADTLPDFTPSHERARQLAEADAVTRGQHDARQAHANARYAELLAEARFRETDPSTDAGRRHGAATRQLRERLGALEREYARIHAPLVARLHTPTHVVIDGITVRHPRAGAHTPTVALDAERDRRGGVGVLHTPEGRVLRVLVASTVITRDDVRGIHAAKRVLQVSVYAGGARMRVSGMRLLRWQVPNFWLNVGAPYRGEIQPDVATLTALGKLVGVDVPETLDHAEIPAMFSTLLQRAMTTAAADLGLRPRRVPTRVAERRALIAAHAAWRASHPELDTWSARDAAAPAPVPTDGAPHDDVIVPGLMLERAM